MAQDPLDSALLAVCLSLALVVAILSSDAVERDPAAPFLLVFAFPSLAGSLTGLATSAVNLVFNRRPRRR